MKITRQQLRKMLLREVKLLLEGKLEIPRGTQSKAIDFKDVPPPTRGSTETIKVKWGDIIKFKLRSGVGQSITIKGDGSFRVRKYNSRHYFESSGRSLTYGRKAKYLGEKGEGLGMHHLQVFPIDSDTINLRISSIRGSDTAQPAKSSAPASKPMPSRAKKKRKSMSIDKNPKTKEVPPPAPSRSEPEAKKPEYNSEDPGGWKKYSRLSEKHGELAAKWIMSTKGDASHFEYFKQWYKKLVKNKKTGTDLEISIPRSKNLSPQQIIKILDQIISANRRISIEDIQKQ